MLPEAHLPLTPQAFQILLSLADRDLHGYAIILDVRERTSDEVKLTASTLYAALQRMLDAGLIEEVERRRTDDDPRRRYYGLTKYGREVARAEARRLERLTEMARGKRLLPGAAPSAHGRKA
jgi:DNA-binding PadR family transcriptional regulator